MQRINIGLIGLGQVGGGLYSILRRKKAHFASHAGVELRIARVGVKHPGKKRKVSVSRNLITSNVQSILKDPDIDVVVELIGGTKEAFAIVTEALRAGKHVVTANKALLAERGDEIFKLADRMKRWVMFEASVGGGIPVIKALREGLVANRIDSIHCIINGTTNYILSQMTEQNLDFSTALKQAQDKGYAEADPTLDIEGVDAAHKLAILVRFAFGGSVRFKDIHCEGISRIRSEDIAFAREFGYRIKLLAIAKRSKDGIEARVQPTLLPQAHILANVNGSFNAVLMRGDEIGEVLFYGRGAGALPTASAIVSDLVDIAKLPDDYLALNPSRLCALEKKLNIKSISSILSRYYLRFHIVDRPGMLGRISQVLGKYKISISDVIQKERKAGSVVPLILLTHDAHEDSVRRAIGVIDKLHGVHGKSQVIRIEEN